MDFMDICTVANLTGNLNSPDPRDWWDGSEINIWEDWDKCTEAQIHRWQFGVNKFFGEGDRIASNWLQTFVYNSSTDSLKTAVAKKYEKLPSNQKGGVIYLYLSLCEMFQMSREVEEAMYKFLDIFKRNGVARYTGENSCFGGGAWSVQAFGCSWSFVGGACHRCFKWAFDLH
jgi:hypothetical protein